MDFFRNLMYHVLTGGVMKIFGQNIYLIMEIRAILKTYHTYLLYSACQMWICWFL